METTLLNLANIATYNPKSHAFEATSNMSANLQAFYEKYNANTAQDINHIDAHNAWADYVENIPDVYYKRIGDLTSKEFITTFDTPTYDGFVPVLTASPTLPKKTITIGSKNYDLYEQKWNNQTFLLVPAETKLVCFEVRSSFRNVIIIMNHLFNLNLYQKSQDTFDPNFETTYFESLCKKLNWDSSDDLSESMRITTKEDSILTLNIIKNAHGYIEYPPQEKTASVFDTEIEQLQAINAVLGATNNMDIKNLYFNNLLDPNERLNVFNTLSESLQKTTSPLFDNVLISFSFIRDAFFAWNLAQNTTITSSMHANSFKTTFFIYGVLFDWINYSIETKVLSASQIQLLFNSCVDLLDHNQESNIIISLISNKALNSSQINLLFKSCINLISNKNQTTPLLNIIQRLIKNDALNSSQVELLLKSCINLLSSSDAIDILLSNNDSIIYASNIITPLIQSKALSSSQIILLLNSCINLLSNENTANYGFNIILNLISNETLESSHITLLLKSCINLLSSKVAKHYASNIIIDLINNKKLDLSQIESLLQSCINLLSNNDMANRMIDIIKDLIKANLIKVNNSINSMISQTEKPLDLSMKKLLYKNLQEELLKLNPPAQEPEHLTKTIVSQT